MGKLKGDDDYEFGYDHLYEEEKPTDAAEDAEGLVDDDEQDEPELEIDQNDYDGDEPDDTGGMESVLAIERIMQEVNVKPPEHDVSEDAPGMLIRETKAEALRRYEEAARSLDDFYDVIATWDKLDQTRKRRERYNEVLREEGALEYGRDGDGLIFP